MKALNQDTTTTNQEAVVNLAINGVTPIIANAHKLKRRGSRPAEKPIPALSEDGYPEWRVDITASYPAVGKTRHAAVLIEATAEPTHDQLIELLTTGLDVDPYDPSTLVAQTAGGLFIPTTTLRITDEEHDKNFIGFDEDGTPILRNRVTNG